MSRVCAKIIGLRIHIFRFADASGRCNGSNRPDQCNGSCPLHASVQNTFNVQRHLVSRNTLRAPPRRSLAELAGSDRGLSSKPSPFRLSFGGSQVLVTIHDRDLCGFCLTPPRQRLKTFETETLRFLTDFGVSA